MLIQWLTRDRRFVGRFGALLASIVVLLTCVSPTFADKVTLKDGTVLEGEVTREGDGFFFFKVMIGQVENERLIMNDQVASLDRTTPVAGANKPTEAAKTIPAGKREKKPGDPTRVAVLNFGLPKATQDRPADMVGIECNVASWEQAVPMLEADGVDVVVVRVASGGGYTLEMPKFNDLFDNVYEKKFRTVVWIEYSISAACMSPWVLDEIYFMRNGRMGGCTEFSGGGNASKGLNLEEILAYMEEASRRGNKNPYIMRSMQIQEPLSCTVDPVTGQVEWFQNTSGEILVNAPNNVLTFNSEMAMKTKFAKGLADTLPELMEAMGISEYEIAGERASEFMDQNIRENYKTGKEWQLVYAKYMSHVDAAGQMQDRDRRGAEVGIARRYLSQLRRMLGINPNYELFYGTDDEWFRNQDQMLRDLMRR